jgi:hypothetical protein
MSRVAFDSNQLRQLLEYVKHMNSISKTNEDTTQITTPPVQSGSTTDSSPQESC